MTTIRITNPFNRTRHEAIEAIKEKLKQGNTEEEIATVPFTLYYSKKRILEYIELAKMELASEQKAQSNQ